MWISMVLPMNLFDNLNFAAVLEHIEYRVWKDTGGHHQAYLERRCNAIKECPSQALYTVLHNNDFTEECACEEHKDKHLYSNSKLTKFIPNVLKPFL